MKTLTLALTIVLFAALGWNYAKAEPMAYVSVYSVDTDCAGVCGVEDFKAAGAFGLAVKHVGAELIATDSDVGGSLYLQYRPSSDFRVYAGVSSVPDTAIVNVPIYGNFSDSTNASAPMIGFDYKMISVRYLEYTAKHSVTKQTRDQDGVVIDSQTGSTKADKSSLWVGLTHRF